MYNKFDKPYLKQSHHIKVYDDLKADAQVWIQFLSQDKYLCRPFMDFSTMLIADDIQFFLLMQPNLIRWVLVASSMDNAFMVCGMDSLTKRILVLNI